MFLSSREKPIILICSSVEAPSLDLAVVPRRQWCVSLDFRVVCAKVPDPDREGSITATTATNTNHIDAICVLAALGKMPTGSQKS